MHSKMIVLLSTLLASGVSLAANNPVVANVAGKEIRLSEVDSKGGERTINLARDLYKARSQYLYLLVSDKLLEEEAKSNGVTTNELIDREISSKVVPLDATAVADYVAQHPEIKDIDQYDRKVRTYLQVQKHKKARNQYINTLFKKHQVNIALYRPPELPAVEVQGEGEVITGVETAPVKITLFSDFECPYCKRLYGALTQLEKAHPNDVFITHRQFPLPNHKLGEEAAKGSYCAGEQGKFKAYYDSVFSSPGRLTGGLLASIPERIGLDGKKFDDCVINPATAVAIEEDKAEGRRIGVQATPTMIINGRKQAGAASFENLEKLIVKRE
jgi:protein-disulfide isomerase